MTKAADPVSYSVGVLIGALIIGIIWWATEPAMPPRTCESTRLRIDAFVACLRQRPACTSVEVEDFVEYFENKNWLDTNCPAESGDGFQS